MKKALGKIFSVVVAAMLCLFAVALGACSKDPVITGITLDTSAVQTTFSEGDDFVYDGLKVIGQMDDETTCDIALTECTVTAPDMYTLGEKDVTVTYGEFTAKYTIEVIHKCTQQCPVCGKCLDMECQDPVCAEKCGDNSSYISYTLEAENENVILHPGARGALGVTRVIDDGGVPEDVKERNSDIVYISNFNASAGATIEFNIWADKESTATLLVSVCKRMNSAIFTQGVAVMVNGEMLERNTYVPATGIGTDTWADFVDVNLGCITLLGGQMNNIQLMNISSDFGYNFDCIKLKTDAKLGWSEKAEDAILADTDTAEYDAAINMTYAKSYDFADIWQADIDGMTKPFTAYDGHLGGAEAAGEEGVCIDGTKAKGLEKQFTFYMISKGTIFVEFYMAAEAGYTADTLLNNVEFKIDDKAVTAANVQFDPNAPFCGRAGQEGVTAPFVLVRISTEVPHYNDLASGAHTLSVKVIGDNAPDMDKLTLNCLKLGQYYDLVSLTADASNAKTQYVINDEFSIEGVVVTATDRNNQTREIPLEDCIITEPDLSTMGTKSVGIAYGRLSASYTVSVKMDMGDLVQNIFEAEDQHVAYGPGHMFGTDENETMPGVSGTYVGNLNANLGATLTFKVNGGEEGGTATLYVSVCKRASTIKFTDSMSVTLNGEALSSEATVPPFSLSEWSEFETIELCDIQLKPGENTIVFTVVNADAGAGFNFDSIMLASELTFGWYEA